jgi:hypothetical protein
MALLFLLYDIRSNENHRRERGIRRGEEQTAQHMFTLLFRQIFISKRKTEQQITSHCLLLNSDCSNLSSTPNTGHMHSAQFQSSEANSLPSNIATRQFTKAGPIATSVVDTIQPLSIRYLCDSQMGEEIWLGLKWNPIVKHDSIWGLCSSEKTVYMELSHNTALTLMKLYYDISLRQGLLAWESACGSMGLNKDVATPALNNYLRAREDSC